MKRKIRRILMIVLLLIFLFSAGMAGYLMLQYHQSSEHFKQAAEQYTVKRTQIQPEEAQQQQQQQTLPAVVPPPEVRTEPVLAPITVDFDALRAVNSDVVGWIYCEDTVIDYPVLHGPDDEFYLHKGYDKSYQFTGSIFVEAENSPDFSDANTIVYGHNMRDGSMFAELEAWKDPAYYEAHPVMWLLTPEQDYQIVLFAGYTTSATSDVYQIFYQPGEDFRSYLDKATAQSDFSADVTVGPDSRCVLLSTCAYVFDQARYVMHGELRPVDSAGGKPLS